MSWPDHFSARASDYARHRPDYPPELFEYLAQLCRVRRTAWDCATGNGQAAKQLGRHFGTVVASDASVQQLRHAVDATPHRVACRAEQVALRDASADLIVVAQALHWFAVPEFFAEVRRIARPGAIFAAWTYPLLELDAPVGDLVRDFSSRVVGPYWPPQRAHVDNGYRDIALPFEEVVAPSFGIRREWSLSDLIGYLGTWSSVRRYRERSGVDPLAALAPRLRTVWGNEQRLHSVRWSLPLRVARVDA